MRRILTFVTIMSLILSTTVIAQSAEAHAEVVKLLESHPETTIESFTGKLCFRNLADLDHSKDGLGKAGIPD